MTGRLALALVLLACWGAAVAVRLFDLQIGRHAEFRALAENQQLDTIELSPPRGTIFDAHGNKLAVSLRVDSAFVDPREIDELGAREALLAGLARVPGIDARRLAPGLARPGSRFLWVARQLHPDRSADLRRRQIPGLRFLQESKRYYPMDRLAAPVLGVVGVDPEGLEGLEMAYDHLLSGAKVERTLVRDALRGAVQSPTLSFRDAEPGQDLYLTIDSVLQEIVERELRAAVRRHGADRGSVLLLDPATGAVLAMASEPGFDPNEFRKTPREQRRNQPVMDAFEPGSTFKVVAVAAALEANLFDPLDLIDCEWGGIAVDGVWIADHKPFAELTVREVVARSSNVGAIKIARAVGGPRLHDQIRAFGFGELTGVDLPGENRGLVRPAERWGRRDWAYFSFGQGLSVTPLQLANLFAAVANGGHLYRPYVVAAIGRDGRRIALHPVPELLGRPIAPATARSLGRLLEAVVEEGTGRGARIPGYRVAGKTGTAEVPIDGRYAPGRYIASFVGYAPARRPALVGAVKIDHPRGAAYHGGEIAAPVFAAVVGEALAYLGVPPEREAPEAWPGEAVAGAGPDPAPPLVAAPVDRGGVPDFSGLSAREAVARSAELGLAPRLIGSGFVTRQWPAAGEPLEGIGEPIALWLTAGSLR